MAVILMVVPAAIFSTFWLRSTQAQSLDMLTISTCRADQSLFRVQIGQQMTGTGTIVAGEARIAPGFIPSGVVVQGVNTIGFRKEGHGSVSPGYAGVAFSAVVPIAKTLLEGITICLY
jgi:hypothetical protein